MAFWYSSGNFTSYLPRQLKQIPLDLKRSHAYPPTPEVTEQGLDEYGQPLPHYVPQRMAFTKWKTPPYEARWAASVLGYLQATNEWRQRVKRIASTYSHVPIQTPEMAVENMGADTLPPLNENPNMYSEPVARQALPLNRMLSAEELNKYAREVNRGELASVMTAADSRNRAMQEVENQHMRYMDFLRREESAPWFMRRA